MNEDLIDCEDIGSAIREDRPLRPATGYRILVAQDSLNFEPAVISDPVPLGRQILTAAGLPASTDLSLFAILQSGDFEDVRLDEPFDVRGKGAERFIVFPADPLYRLVLNGSQIVWGHASIHGQVLYDLANAEDDQAVFLDVPGGTDRLIEPDEHIDLSERGVERFLIARKPPTTYEIIIKGQPYVVGDKRVTFEQVVALAFPGPQAPNVRFTMTYRNAASVPHAGELSAGQGVDVKPTGSIFNVTRCVQS